MQTTDESELFKSTFEKQQHKCYFCGKELKESEAFIDKFVTKPHIDYPNLKLKDEDNRVILCKDCATKRSWNDIYLKFPSTGKLINKKGKSAERKDMSWGVVLALLFGWLGLFYSNKTYAQGALLVWLGLIVLFSLVLHDFPVLMIILSLLYAAGCVVASVKAIKKQHAIYDECMKHEY